MAFERQNLTKTCNETLILAMLTGGPKHGYQLAVELDEASQGYFSFKHGTLYPILHKLEKDGLIKGVWDTNSPKRKRKAYTISTKGRKTLQQHTAGWQTFCSNILSITGGEAK